MEFAVGLVVLLISYIFAFVATSSKYSWLVAGAFCAVIACGLAYRAIMIAGFPAQRFAITAITWFVSGSIAGVVATLIPNAGPQDGEVPSE
ncbi:hypothetical protein BH11ARM1_BH11ARM1_08860 [soil metagenome]